MPDTSELITAIKQAEASYEPDTRIAERLQQVTLVSLIGPSAAGKTTVMRAASELDSDFGRIISFTTRERRQSEESDTYEFLQHDPATLRNILDQIENHELVQFTAHPTTGHVYGSHIAAYNKPFMMLDTMPGAFEGLSKLPFKEIKKIALVANTAEWRSRFFERPDSKDDMAKRVGEGVLNLSWSLEHSDEVVWLDNSHRSAEETARQLIDIVKNNTPYDDTAARRTGEALLAAMQAMK